MSFAEIAHDIYRQWEVMDSIDSNAIAIEVLGSGLSRTTKAFIMFALAEREYRMLVSESGKILRLAVQDKEPFDACPETAERMQ